MDLNNWFVYCTLNDKPKAQIMISMYKQVCGPLGIKFGPEPVIIVVQQRGRNPSGIEWRNAVRSTAKPGEVSIVFIGNSNRINV